MSGSHGNDSHRTVIVAEWKCYFHFLSSFRINLHIHTHIFACTHSSRAFCFDFIIIIIAILWMKLIRRQPDLCFESAHIHHSNIIILNMHMCINCKIYHFKIIQFCIISWFFFHISNNNKKNYEKLAIFWNSSLYKIAIIKVDSQFLILLYNFKIK